MCGETEGEGGEGRRQAAHPGTGDEPSPVLTGLLAFAEQIPRALCPSRWGYWKYLARLQTLGLEQQVLNTQRCLV